MAGDEGREPERIPLMVLEEKPEPKRFLRDPWRLSRGEVIRLLVFCGIVLVLFALATFLVWRRLRIRPLLRPIPHRTRPTPPASGAAAWRIR